MKSSIRQTSFFRSPGRQIMMAFAFVSVLGGVSISPALADDDRRDGWRQDRHRGGDHDRRDRHRDRHREWRGDRGGYYTYQPEYRQPYYYAQPVYVPPPVYYEPRPSPGVSLFFPLDLRR